jgi:putative membrane protein
MKRSTLVFFFSAAIAGACTLGACNNGAQSNNQDSVDSAKNMNDTSATAMMVDEMDSKFAVNAADIGMAEVEMGKTAEQKAMNAKIKSFASMMVMDHTQANEELKSAAAAKNITLPAAIGEDHQEHLTKLSQKTGRDFDKEYIDMMVDGHKKAIDLFEKEASDGKDADLKTWAANKLPTLRQHLDSAKAIRDMIKK